MTVHPKSTVQISASTRKQIIALSALSTSSTQIHHTPTAASYQHMAQTDNIYIWVNFEIGGFCKKLPSSHQVIGEREKEAGGEEGGR